MSGVPLLTVAPNGARRSQRDHPALPVTSAQIATTAKACFAAGAKQIHLHVRDAQGGHSLDAGRYRAAIAAISQEAPEMAVQITTESAGLYDVATQYACLQALVPAAASVALRELAQDPATAARLFAFAAEAGIQLQLILYSPEDFALLSCYKAKNAGKGHLNSVLFVLGRYAPPCAGQPTDLSGFLMAAEGMDLDWSVCAFGRNELACAKAALWAGGSVRIGFENNIHLPDGRLARDNAQNVALAQALIDELQHPQGGPQ